MVSMEERFVASRGVNEFMMFVACIGFLGDTRVRSFTLVLEYYTRLPKPILRLGTGARQGSSSQVAKGARVDSEDRTRGR